MQARRKCWLALWHDFLDGSSVHKPTGPASKLHALHAYSNAGHALLLWPPMPHLHRVSQTMFEHLKPRHGQSSMYTAAQNILHTETLAHRRSGTKTHWISWQQPVVDVRRKKTDLTGLNPPRKSDVSVCWLQLMMCSFWPRMRVSI